MTVRVLKSLFGSILFVAVVFGALLYWMITTLSENAQHTEPPRTNDVSVPKRGGPQFFREEPDHGDEDVR